jgi:hypothetical protein
MEGKRVGMLTVGIQAPSVSTSARWHCLCDCGTPCIVDGSRLRVALKTGNKSSCGCYHPRRKRVA